MKKITILFGLVLPLLAYSQNLNPTVEVTRTYEGKIVEVHKEGTDIFVPDSLSKFDYHVDYFVFDNPYKGSYEFHPYIIEMKPEPCRYDGSILYFDAGCQYPLAPSTHIVFSPNIRKGDFGISVWGNMDSYYGKMKSFTTVYDTEYLNAEGGVSGSFDSRRTKVNFDAGYRYLSNKDDLCHHGLGKVFANLRFSSPKETVKGFLYDFKFAAELGSEESASENIFSTSVMLGIPTGKLKRGKLGLAFGGNLVSGEGFEYDKSFMFYACPNISYDGVRGHAVLGAKVSLPFVISPMLKADWFLVPKYLDVYVEADGGAALNSYSSILAMNPFICQGMLQTMMATKQKLSSRAGFRGIAGTSFSYDVFGGYSMLTDALCETMNESGYRPVFCSYNVFHGGIRFAWKSDRMDLTAGGVYSSAKLEESVFSIPKIKADFKAEYNWSRRVFARVGLEYNSERTCSYIECPSWVDLGVGLEYKINTWLSVWLKAGNLLNQNVQRYLLHARDGVNFGGGLCVNLRKNS